MRINQNKLWAAVYERDKLPRKLKKYALGKKMRRGKLRRMLDETILGPPITTMYERREFHPHGAFCPNCGHAAYYGTGNQTSYPEHWEYFYCLKCHAVVGYIDNSPFIHALECKEFDYNPVF